jgi:hypothetical protein
VTGKDQLDMNDTILARQPPPDQESERALDIFRAAFEERFAPLGPREVATKSQELESESESDSWAGLSDNEVPVINTSLPPTSAEDKAAFRQYMVSRSRR